MSDTAFVTMVLRMLLARIETAEIETDTFFRRHVKKQYPKLYKKFYEPISPMLPLNNFKWNLREVVDNIDDPYIGILEMLKKEDKAK